MKKIALVVMMALACGALNADHDWCPGSKEKECPIKSESGCDEQCPKCDHKKCKECPKCNKCMSCDRIHADTGVCPLEE